MSALLAVMVRTQPQSDPSPRHDPNERQTSRKVSCRTSSASSAVFVRRRARLYTPPSYARYSCSRALSSPALARAMRLRASPRGIVSAMTVTILEMRMGGKASQIGGLVGAGLVPARRIYGRPQGSPLQDLQTTILTSLSAT